MKIHILRVKTMRKLFAILFFAGLFTACSDEMNDIQPSNELSKTNFTEGYNDGYDDGFDDGYDYGIDD